MTTAPKTATPVPIITPTTGGHTQDQIRPARRQALGAALRNSWAEARSRVERLGRLRRWDAGMGRSIMTYAICWVSSEDNTEPSWVGASDSVGKRITQHLRKPQRTPCNPPGERGVTGAGVHGPHRGRGLHRAGRIAHTEGRTPGTVLPPLPPYNNCILHEYSVAGERWLPASNLRLCQGYSNGVHRASQSCNPPV